MLIALAFLAFISLGLPDAVLGVAWPTMRGTFGLPLPALGGLLASSMVGYLASTFSTGWLMRRLGVGELLAVSSTLVTASLVGFALAPAWWVILACGVISGLGAGAIDAGINAFAAQRFSPRVVAWLHAAYGVGATAGPVLMTAVLAAGRPWRFGYGTLAVVLAVMTALFFATLRAWDAPAPGAATSDDVVTPADLRDTLRLPMAWLNVALFFLYVGIEVSAGQWLYTLFALARGVPHALAGLTVGAFWAGLTGGRIVAGILAHYLSRTAILRAAMLLAPCAAAVLAFAPPYVALAGAPLLGLGLAPIYPMLISDTPRRVGQAHAANAVGLQVCSAYLGIMALPTSAGFLMKSAGLEMLGPFLLLTTIGLLGLHELSLRILAAPRPSRPPAVQPSLDPK